MQAGLRPSSYSPGFSRGEVPNIYPSNQLHRSHWRRPGLGQSGSSRLVPVLDYGDRDKSGPPYTPKEGSLPVAMLSLGGTSSRRGRSRQGGRRQPEVDPDRQQFLDGVNHDIDVLVAEMHEQLPREKAVL